MIRSSELTLNQLVVFVLTGAFALVLLEVRYLHQPVLGEHAIAWTPIAYSGLMVVACAVGLFLWNQGGRRALCWLFAPALVIGPVGCWYHNGGQPLRGFKREVAAWAQAVDHDHEHAHATVKESEGDGSAQHAGPDRQSNTQPRGDQATEAAGSDEGSESDAGGEPPPSAPLAISGLGILGMLACARRLQSSGKAASEALPPS